MFECSIYETDHDGNKQLLVSAPTRDEAEEAFSILRTKIPRLRKAEIDWQFTFFDDEKLVGEIR